MTPPPSLSPYFLPATAQSQFEDLFFDFGLELDEVTSEAEEQSKITGKVRGSLITARHPLPIPSPFLTYSSYTLLPTHTHV